MNIIGYSGYILGDHSSKQCKVSTFCKKLVEGSAPSSEACRPALAENDPPDHFPGAASPAEEFFIPLKFSGREPLGEQENLQSVKSDPSLFTEASALPMR